MMVNRFALTFVSKNKDLEAVFFDLFNNFLFHNAPF